MQVCHNARSTECEISLENKLVSISVRGWLDPKATERGQKEEVTEKF
jgi:hypothetical protein